MNNMTSARAPDGTVWHIKIRWMPRWRALARRFGGWRDGRRSDRHISDAADWIPDPTSLLDTDGSGGWFDFDFDIGDDLLGALTAIVMLIIAGVLLWWVVLPLLLVVLDLAIVVVLLVAGVAGRVLLDRPWTLEATTSSGRRYTRQVVGWRKAQAEIRALASEITAGTAALLDVSQVHA